MSLSLIVGKKKKNHGLNIPPLVIGKKKKKKKKIKSYSTPIIG